MIGNLGKIFLKIGKIIKRLGISFRTWGKSLKIREGDWEPREHNLKHREKN